MHIEIDNDLCLAEDIAVLVGERMLSTDAIGPHPGYQIGVGGTTLQMESVGPEYLYRVSLVNPKTYEVYRDGPFWIDPLAEKITVN